MTNMTAQEYSDALDHRISNMTDTLKKDLELAKQGALIMYAIEHKNWMYIEYEDSKKNFTARLVKPKQFLPYERNGMGFLAQCEMREAPFRHFKLERISKMIIVEGTTKWERS